MKSLLFALILQTAIAAQPVIVNRSTSIVIDEREPGPVRKAAQDLVSDMQKVFGAKPRIVNTAAEARGPAIVIACDWNRPPAVAKPLATESFRIATLARPSRTVVLAGADVRGTIYAIYEFSQRFLRVDPLYYWTDHEPSSRTSVTVTSIEGASPAFRHRGWFINDEDLLTGWAPGRKDNTAISLEVWDHVFEALLRLRGNMIVPGTFIFPDEPQVRAAGARGLIVTQHHIEVLGTNTYRWPDDKPYSFAQQPQLLINAWRNAVRQYSPTQEVIWTVGYRGRHDRAFWVDDKSIPPTDEARANAIRQAIDKQLEIVRAERKNPYFLMNAWMEAVPFIQKGVLKLPAGVTLVWPDNGHGIIRDEGTIGKGQGVYYHTAMYNGVANQLTEMVPLERIERELGRAASAGATEYLLVNVSDVRPYPMTTRAVMDLAVKGTGWQAKDYLRRWCREEFGDKAAAAVAAYYRAYFQAPGRYGAPEQQTLADNAYHNFMRLLLVGLIQGEADLDVVLKRRPAWMAILNLKNAAHFTGEAQQRWAAARELALKAEKLVPPERRPFFQSHVMTQLGIHEHSNRALQLTAEAWGERGVAGAKIAGVVAELKLVLAAMHAAEYGKWRGFYDEDRFVNVRKSLALAEGAEAKLAGKPLPKGLVVEAFIEDSYAWLKAYQHGRRVDTR